MSVGAAHSFFDAVNHGDADAMRAALRELQPVLTPAIRRALQRQEALVRRCRLEVDDVVQRVFERMLTSPPDNRADRNPTDVLVAWSRAVALNYLLELARRRGREAAALDDDDDGPIESASQERRHVAHERWQLARRCADTELAKYKHLRELFYAIAEEPDLGARELARRIGLTTEADDDAALRRAEQYVWKLRERVQQKLADYLEALDP